MKMIFLLIFFIPLFCSAQKYSLIHKRWSEPVRVTDTITNDDFDKGWFPLYRNETDSLLSVLDKLTKLYKSGAKRKLFNEKEFSTPHIQFQIATVKFAYGDRYDVTMTSETDLSRTSLKLCQSNLTDAQNNKKIEGLISYLEKNKPVWRGYLQ